MRAGARALLLAAVIGLAAPRALASPDTEGGPPGGNVGPGDIQRPPSGAPAAPAAPGTPVTAEEVQAGTGPAGTPRLMGSLLGAAGQDPTGAAGLFGGSLSSALEGMIESALLMASSEPEQGTGFAPLPVIASSRNEGTTVGAMMPIFFRNGQGDVDKVVAPMLTYNKIFGIEGGAHAIYYHDSLYLGAGAIISNHVARNLYLEALDYQLFDSKFALEFFAKNEVDPSSRFWGFGPTADFETNNTFRETVFRLNIGINFPQWNLQIFGRERFRDVYVGSHGIPSIPSTTEAFPDAPGIPAATLAGEALEFRWDRRDEAFLPKNGWWIGGVAEVNCGLKGETSRWYPRYIIDARGFYTPRFAEIVTLAARVRFERLTGSEVPFYEQAILGGRNSLRAYGADRWTDLASALIQIEVRTTVLSITLFGTRTMWQVVPFFDYGRVFRDLDSKVFRLWRWSPGIGFRLAVPPNIIGRVDIGYGNEGSAVFVGLGLPF